MSLHDEPDTYLELIQATADHIRIPAAHVEKITGSPGYSSASTTGVDQEIVNECRTARLAIHTSRIEPLPHQITAVSGEMLPRQPLRFLLTDDPGADKTIMAGLLIKELMIRGDVAGCLVVAPGALVEQWQDELDDKFGLPFDILTRDKMEAARTANPSTEHNLLIARLDMLSRNPDIQSKLRAAKEWDLVVCDEAHRMSASFSGGEVKYTKRYQLGQLLGTVARHFMLMTATPHNGKEEDFQLFMALLDGDRFEGRFRDGVHQADVSDLMRRLTKEELLRFDGRPLFPEARSPDPSGGPVWRHPSIQAWETCRCRNHAGARHGRPAADMEFQKRPGG